MNLEAKYRKKSKMAYRRIGDEPFLVPVCGRPEEMEKIFILNSLADFVWQRLDGEHSLEDILAGIIDNYEVSMEKAGADMEKFVSQLLEEDLIEGVA